MVVFSSSASFLLVLTPLVVAQRSFLQPAQRHQHSGDWDETEVKLCTFGAKTGHDNPIKVFADESDNTRYVSFAREGHATDDGFIESMQKCKGSLPEACKHKSTNSTPSGCVACPCELDVEHAPFGNYQRRMLELVTPSCQSHSTKEPFHVLLVGLGGGALVQYILGKCPQGTVVQAIEYDPRMIEISAQFFGLTASQDAFKVEQGDGGAVVAAHAAKGQTYNMVLVDAFAGGSHVPESCRNAAFVSNLRHLLRKGGSVLHNLAGPTVSNLAGPDDFKTTLPLYQETFGSSSVKLEELTGNLEFPSRLIVARVP
jgi:hypothetical protein